MNARPDTVLERLGGWAARDTRVLAAIINGSRARPGAGLDALSDYDVLLLVDDAERLAADAEWYIDAYGDVLVSIPTRTIIDGIDTHTRLVIYADGVKVDFVLWPPSALERFIARGILPHLLDVGYRVLADKIGVGPRLPPATHSAHIPARPSGEAYAALVNEFWWETSYIAKNIARDELLPARYSLDVVVRYKLLLPMLEWYVELSHDWAWKPGVLGRGLRAQLEEAIWSELRAAIGSVDETRASLVAAIALFRRCARGVAGALGYHYPGQLDARVSAYIASVMDQPL
jgi:aminoglycoside 6-adenylyltransferase